MKRLATLTVILIVLMVVLLAGVLAGDLLLKRWKICPTVLAVGEDRLADAVSQTDAGCGPDVDCGLNVGFWPGEANPDQLGLKLCVS